MQRRRALSLLAGTAAAQLPLPALAQSPRIRLGQSVPLSGPAAELGVQLRAGARLLFDRVNAQGGVGGRTIELLTLDDGYEPERCKANTETLTHKEDVLALFGYVGTPTSMAAMPLVQSAKVPFFAPVTGAEALREPFNRQVFHVRASYYDETALIVKQLTAVGLTRIAVFRQNDSYGQAGFDGVVRALKAKQLDPVAVGLVERNSVDVAAAVQAIVAAKPQAIVQISTYKSCAAFIREARKAGYGSTFYNVSFVGTQALGDELGKEAAGVMVSQVMPFPFNATLAISREYQEAVKTGGHGATPNYSSMEGYVAAKVLVEGLRRLTKDVARDALIGALESLPRLDLGGYSVNFNTRDHRGSGFVDLSMLTGDGRVKR